MFLHIGAAQAQARDIPSAAQIGQQNTAIEEDELPVLLPRGEGLVSRTPDLPAEVAEQTFVLRSLDLRGATIIDQKKLTDLIGSFEGREITVSQLFGILNSIQQYYLDEGYTLTKVVMPEQSLDDGHVVFNVIEGYVAEVELNPEMGPNRMLADFRQRILAQRPLNLKDLERMMLILNDRPGKDLSAVLATLPLGATENPGAVKLLLQQNTSPKPLSAFMSLDNFGSAYTGTGQITGGLSINDTGFRQSDLFLSSRITTSHQELQQLAADYTLPLWGVSGLNFTLSGSVTRTEPGAELDILDVAGRSVVFRAGFDYPLIRQRTENLFIGSSLQIKNVETDILGNNVFDDRIRSVSARAQYGFMDGLNAQNNASVIFSQGLNIMNASTPASTRLSRVDGRNDFSLWKVNYSRLQPVFGPWEISITLRGQYSNKPLLSPEEFGVGGSDLGRGYDPSEITGDRGVAGALELRNNSRLHNINLDLQPFVFYDIGKVWNIDPSAGDRVSAASAGVGIRAVADSNFSTSLVLAQPLTLAASKPPKYSDPDGIRILFSLTKTF